MTPAPDGTPITTTLLRRGGLIFGYQAKALPAIAEARTATSESTHPNSYYRMNSTIKIGYAVNLGVICTAFICGNAAEAIRTFPGKDQSLTSPDKKSVLFNIDAESHADIMRLGNQHALFLREKKDRKQCKVHSYARHIMALWSPNSQFVALTDFEASNRAAWYVYSVGEAKLTDVAESMTKQLQSDPKSHHIYFQAIAWRDDHSLVAKLTAYGKQNGSRFERRFIYNPVSNKSTPLAPK